MDSTTDRKKGHQDAWSRFCESMGNRCSHVDADGVRCDNGVGKRRDGRCPEHGTEGE